MHNLSGVVKKTEGNRVRVFTSLPEVLPYAFFTFVAKVTAPVIYATRSSPEGVSENKEI